MTNLVLPTTIPSEKNPSVSSYQQRRERIIQVILYIASGFGLPAVIASALGTTDRVLIGLYIASYFVLLLVTFIKLPYWMQSVTLLVLVYALGFSGLTEAGIWGGSRLFFLGFITMATLLFSLSAGIVATLISFASILVIGQLVVTRQFQLTSSQVMPGGLETWISGGAGLLVLAIIIMSAIHSIQQEFEKIQKSTNEYLQIMIEERASLEERVEERTSELNRRSTQLEAAALVARAAAEVHDLKELLDSVVRQISIRFGFYHASIFLTDLAGQQVILAAASSEGGQRMLERGHKLEIGRQGIVGFAAYQKRSRIAQDVGADETFFNNPDLPDTHSEVALPLLVQNRLIGVLDIQSQENNSFTPDDVYTLQTMADQIAMAIENTRLIEQSRTAIQDLEAISTANTTKAWRDRLKEQIKGYLYTPLGVNPLTRSNGGAIDTQNERAIRVPLNLRGKEIGALSLKRKTTDSSWADAEKEMLGRISTQIVLAVENARLLEESQKRAAREQTVNEFSSHFSRSLDVDTLLQNAIREIHKLPQVSEVSVLIKPAGEAEISE
jgi:GAF domain-containing protein